jgi:pilus assembly protein FimV
METPTIESPSLEATMESPIEPPSGEATMETPTIESPVGDWADEPSGSEEVDSGSVERTAEIELDDLGLDLSDLDDVVGADDADDGGFMDDTGVQAELHAETLRLDADSLEVLDDDTLSRPVPGAGGGLAGTTEGADPALEGANIDATAEHLVFGDTVEQPSGGDTVEQPSVDGATAEQPAFSGAGSTDAEELAEAGETSAGVDFEVGETFVDSDDTTSVLSATDKGDGETQTEVGTKLDLARAYIDMGDPDGARSILNEVVEEASDEQRQEARKLLDDLAD